MGLQRTGRRDRVRALVAAATVLMLPASVWAAHFIVAPIGDADDGRSIVLPELVASSATTTDHTIGLAGLPPSSLVIFDVRVEANDGHWSVAHNTNSYGDGMYVDTSGSEVFFPGDRHLNYGRNVYHGWPTDGPAITDILVTDITGGSASVQFETSAPTDAVVRYVVWEGTFTARVRLWPDDNPALQGTCEVSPASCMGAFDVEDPDPNWQIGDIWHAQLEPVTIGDVTYESAVVDVVLTGEGADLAPPLMPQAVPVCPGDLDGDGFRNVTDFTLFAAAYGSQVGDPNYNPDADLNGDGFVNVTDFTHFAAVYGVACP